MRGAALKKWRGAKKQTKALSAKQTILSPKEVVRRKQQSEMRREESEGETKRFTIEHLGVVFLRIFKKRNFFTLGGLPEETPKHGTLCKIGR